MDCIQYFNTSILTAPHIAQSRSCRCATSGPELPSDAGTGFCRTISFIYVSGTQHPGQRARFFYCRADSGQEAPLEYIYRYLYSSTRCSTAMDKTAINSHQGKCKTPRTVSETRASDPPTFRPSKIHRRTVSLTPSTRTHAQHAIAARALRRS
jgi:hypothetical protein